jgi:predicted kinase
MREPFVAYVERELGGSPVLIACGLPATNKTETMEVVARVHGYQVVRSDLVRLEVLANEDIFDEEKAASMSKRTLVYDEMFRRAQEAAERGDGVILDATFVSHSLRLRAAAVAVAAGTTLVIQQTHCSEQYSLAKLAKRTRDNYESNALTPVAYYNNVKKFEPVDLEAIQREHPSLEIVHLVVETESDDEAEWYVIERHEV